MKESEDWVLVKSGKGSAEERRRERMNDTTCWETIQRLLWDRQELSFTVWKALEHGRFSDTGDQYFSVGREQGIFENWDTFGHTSQNLTGTSKNPKTFEVRKILYSTRHRMSDTHA